MRRRRGRSADFSPRWRRSPASSQTALLAAGAAHPHRRTSSAGMLVSSAAARCRSGVAAAVSLGGQQDQAVEQEVEGPGSVRRGEGFDGTTDLEQDVSALEMPERAGGEPGDEIGLAGEPDVERFETARRLAARAGQASLRRPAANARWPRRRSTRARWNASSASASAMVISLRESSNAPACRLTSAAAERPLGAARRVFGQLDCSLQERGGGGDAATSLGAAGRSFQLGGDVLVGPGAAQARCHARRSGSVSASVASASARCTRWRSWVAAER